MSLLMREEPSAARVKSHYEPESGNAEGMARVVAILDEMAIPVSTADLMSLDQFHAKGVIAVKELADLAGVNQTMRILDAGSGLGGPARYLAQTFGCRVTGIDLTPSFVELAQLLAQRTGLSDQVSFEVGSILDLPYPDASFDLVWTQHVVMNIRDRVKVYREFKRVLGPGGKLAFHDIYLSDDKTEPTFPLGWATTPETSFLLTKAETIEALAEAGFSNGEWTDDTEKTMAVFQAQMQALASSPPKLNLGTFLGPRARELGGNIGQNLREGRLRVGMGVYSAV